MAMIKVVPAGSQDKALCGEPQARLVKMASGGLRGDDFRAFVKRAGHQMMDELKHLKFASGEVPVHLIALGAYEFYGCLTAGTPVLMWDGRYCPIESINVGDEVVSAEGRIRPVVHCFRHADVPTLSLDVSGLPDPLTCSVNHPLRVARKEQFVCDHDCYKRCLPSTQGKQNICNRTLQVRECVQAPYREIHTDWATADSVREGDFLVWTAPQLEPAFGLCVQDGYLLGAWLAEGSFQRNGSNGDVSSARLSIGWHEEVFAEKLRDTCDVLGLRCNIYRIPSSPSEQVVTVTGAPELFRLWHRTFGEHARHKFLPPWTCCLPRNVRLAILAGYLDGDGSCVVNTKENRTTARCGSNDLGAGLQRLCWSLGMPAVRCHSHSDASWNLSVANSYLQGLAPYSWKVRGRELNQTSKIHGFCHRNRAYLPVRAIQQAGLAEVFNLEVEEDHTYCSANVDSHNSNRNGDAFKEAACRKYHKTFEKHARAFRNHDNKVQSRSYGVIKLASYNEPMHRIELIVALNGTKQAAERNGGLVADEELSDLEKKGEYGVSMACRVPHDVCSICGNQARTRAEYCTGRDQGGECSGGGLRDKIATVLDDGRQVYADNPDPLWFDISKVWRPADRIAWTNGILKAAGIQILGGAALAEVMGVTAPWPVLYADAGPAIKVAAALASRENDMAAGGQNGLGLAFVPEVQEPTSWCDHGGRLGEVLAALAHEKVAMPLTAFVELVSGRPVADPNVLTSVRRALPGVYTRMLEDGSLEKTSADNPFMPAAAASERLQVWAAKKAADYSLGRRYLLPRATRGGLYREKPAYRSTLTEKSAAAAEELARAYALYKLALLQNLADKDPDFELTCTAAVQQNYL